MHLHFFLVDMPFFDGVGTRTPSGPLGIKLFKNGFLQAIRPPLSPSLNKSCKEACLLGFYSQFWLIFHFTLEIFFSM